MANICINFITITGDNNQLKALSKRLTEQDQTLLQIIPNFTINPISDYCINDSINIENQIENEGEIHFYFGSKWNCPLESITKLSEEYPNLTFELNFEESANEYFGIATITSSNCYENLITEQEYSEKFNPEYIDKLSDLQEYSYEDFVQNYTHSNFFDERPFKYLDRLVVKRIKDEDLVKFINRIWFDKEAKEEYKRRLSGISIK